MKLSGAKVEPFLRAPDSKFHAVLLFGPDEGLIRERSLRLAKQAVDNLDDPFCSVDMQGADLKTDPARLADEANSLSFGGGRRLVRVFQASDSCVDACQSLMDSPANADTMVLIEGGDLSPRSKLRKLFEKAKNAVCLPCYGDDARSLSNVIRESLTQHNLRADANAMALLNQSLGSDRSVTRGELDKLALYMGKDRNVTQEHVLDVLGDCAANSLDDVMYALSSGNFQALETTLTRTLADGTNPIQIVRAAQRHFQRFHLARGAMASGKNSFEAVKSLRPPLIYFRVEAFKSQLNQWSSIKLTHAFNVLTQAETDCKTTNRPAAAIMGRALLSLCKLARTPNPR